MSEAKVIEGEFVKEETPAKKLAIVGAGVLADFLDTPKEKRKAFGKKLFGDFVDALEKKFK